MDMERRIQVKMGNLLVNSSKFILDRFLTDNGDEEDAFIQSENFYQRLTVAANRKLLVVLQIKSAKMKNVEVVSGWVLSKRTNGRQVIIKILNNPSQWRIIEIDSILKMSQLPRADEQIKTQELN